ncbi:S9 family peptidase [Rhodococcus sp. SGAir0479]|nr:S9 family peptidase [Rhodococcus sp. SGAir0479]
MSATPFHDLDDYLALPRASALTLSPDGSRLALTQSVLDDTGTRYVSALWDVDPAGERPARRLTWGSKGESGAAFTHDGDLLFTAVRPAPDETDDAPASLWRLPASGGEASRIATRGGGLSGVRAARSAPRFVASTGVLGTSGTVDDDERIRGERKDRKVTAVLHTGYPVRYWDHDLGPEVPHLVAGSSDEATVEFADLTPAPGAALRDADYDLAADGSFVVSTWTVPGALGSRRTMLVRIDAATGRRTTLVDDEAADLMRPAIAPDGTSVAYLREAYGDPDNAPRITLHRYTFGSAAIEDLTADWDRWPTALAWLPDGSGLLLTADDHGRGPVFVLRGDRPVPLTTDAASYTELCPAPDGTAVYALRASYERPAHPVRIALTGDAAGAVTELRAPAGAPRLPGRLTEVVGQGLDGTPLRAWLALPDTACAASPAPLVLWVHGGPLNSWNTWSWRWNPWLLVAQGYAVLLPDPALSTGYGRDFVQRGWGQWGKAPYTDLMAITDTAVALPEIDAKRTAAMGGSFGGYMANWIAGHTDRFRAIVTHAGLWALDQFAPTTDAAWYWQREMTPEMAFENSPHLFVADIVTPMLVIHGDKDYRVPIGEGLRLWYELLSESGLPADADGTTGHRFLYFPDENHWVLAPQHAKVWYQVVASFLAQHVRGEDVPVPDVLG